MHIETVNLADDDYELVPADSRVDQEINLNYANLNQDLVPTPEDSRFVSDQEAKPWCIIPLFYALMSSNYSYVM